MAGLMDDIDRNLGRYLVEVRGRRRTVLGKGRFVIAEADDDADLLRPSLC